jgi:hypothetical protein
MVQRANRFTSLTTRLSGALALAAVVCAGACASTTPVSSTAAAPSSATAADNKASADDSLTRGGASVFVVHLMSDFDGFKKYFEDGAAARAQAGIKGHLLTRLDDGRAVVHLFADDVAQVQAVLKSPEMERYLERKGAPESSLLWLTENEAVKIPATAPEVPTFSLYLKLRVTDFAALDKGFRENLPLFAEHAVIGEGLHRSFDRDIAILHFMGTSREKLEALAKRPEFGELVARAGSQGELKPFVGSDVLRSRPETLANAK